MKTAGLKVSTPTDTTVVFTRSFNAPRKLVWEAMVNPELLPRWMFCPPGWSWSTCEMNVRVGGKYRWAWNGPDGQLALSIWGTYKEVAPHSKIVHTERMEMGPGAGCGPDGGGAEPWELLATLEFTEDAGATLMKMTLSFDNKMARDMALKSGMEHGMEAGYKSLDTYLNEQTRR